MIEKSLDLTDAPRTLVQISEEIENFLSCLDVRCYELNDSISTDACGVWRTDYFKDYELEGETIGKLRVVAFLADGEGIDENRDDTAPEYGVAWCGCGVRICADPMRITYRERMLFLDFTWTSESIAED